MADEKKSKKETVRISLSAPPESDPAELHDSTHVDLPPRPPAAGPLRPPERAPSSESPPPDATAEARPAVQPPNARAPFRPPPVARPDSVSTNAAAEPPPLRPESHPKKETARISILPERVPAPQAARVNMTKTQPLIKAPDDEPSAAALKVRSAEPIRSGVDAIPLPILWALLGVSALTFLIQVWNYFSV